MAYEESPSVDASVEHSAIPNPPTPHGIPRGEYEVVRRPAAYGFHALRDSHAISGGDSGPRRADGANAHVSQRREAILSSGLASASYILGVSYLLGGAVCEQDCDDDQVRGVRYYREGEEGTHDGFESKSGVEMSGCGGEK